MYPRERLEYERQIWKQKSSLRTLKADYYAQVRALLPAQRKRVVELGSGCGGLKESIPGVIQTDIFPTPWVDVVTAAERLPFADASVDGLIGLDVLHHLEEPLRFFREAARVLRAGGRLILIDPYVSLGSWLPWHCLHHEACSMREPYDLNGRFDRENNARATLWFDGNRARTEAQIRPLRLEALKTFDLFYYPLTGGFRPWSLIPSGAAPLLLRADRWLGRWLGRWFGYRILLAFEKGAAA